MASKRSSRRRVLTEAERTEKRAAERKLMEGAIEQLRSSEGWQRWLRTRAYFHRYSFRNQLLIARQRPDATYLAGFRRWLDLGYAVRKGERGLVIWAPCPPPKKKMREWREAGANPKEKPHTFFRQVKVFDRAQVDPLPDFPGGPAPLHPPTQPISGEGLAALMEPLADFATTRDYTFAVEKIEGGVKGCCSHSPERISIAPVAEDFSANAQVAVAIHECAHMLVRTERTEEDPKLSYAEEEVIVECVAYTVCSAAGLDTAGAAVPYMASWGDGTELERHAALVDRLAARLEGAILPVLAPDDGGGSCAIAESPSVRRPSRIREEQPAVAVAA